MNIIELFDKYNDFVPRSIYTFFIFFIYYNTLKFYTITEFKNYWSKLIIKTANIPAPNMFYNKEYFLYLSFYCLYDTAWEEQEVFFNGDHHL